MSFLIVLATDELEKLGCITSLNDYNIQGASIDLSLGDKAKIRNDKDIDLFDENALDQELYGEIDLAKGYTLKPKEFLYSSSVEKVTIPKDKCGLIVPRSTFARLGLILPIPVIVDTYLLLFLMLPILISKYHLTFALCKFSFWNSKVKQRNMRLKKI